MTAWLPKVVFCDWYATLCHEPFWASALTDPVHPLHATLAPAVSELFTDKPLMHAWMRGELTDLDICGRLAASGAGADAERLHALLRSDCARMRPDQALLALLDALPAPVRLIVATDNMLCCSDVLLDLPGMRRFERVLCSAELGAVKDTPDAFFGACLNDLDVEFADCVLIDDSPGGCAAFTRAGGRALVYRDAEHAAGDLARLWPGR